MLYVYKAFCETIPILFHSSDIISDANSAILEEKKMLPDNNFNQIRKLS